MLMFCNQSTASASLNDLSAYLLDEYGIEISKQSINERFNDQAVKFLQEVLTNQLNTSLDLQQYRSDLKGIFNRVLIKDSTRFHLPEEYADKYAGHGGCTANSKSMISIQFEYEHITGKVYDLSLTSGRRNDQQDAREKIYHIKENDLRISDLGYATMAYMKAIHDQKAFFLNRFHPQCAAYDPITGEALNFQTISDKMKKEGLNCIEKEVLVGSQYKLPCRIVISLVADQVYDQRIRKAKKVAKSNGYQLSKDYKTRAALSIFVTNAPPEKIATKQVIDLYRLRWQIELIFKVWKSLGKIDNVVKVKLQRFECHLLAKLILLMANWSAFLVVNQWMSQQKEKAEVCSLWKFFKQAMSNTEKLKQIFFDNKPVDKWLYVLFKKANKNLVREKRKGKIPSLNLMNIILT